MQDRELPLWIQILQYTYKHLETNNSNITKHFDKNHDTIRKHLKNLKDSGLINIKREGRDNHITLTEEGIQLMHTPLWNIKI